LAAQAGHEATPAADQLPAGQVAQAVELDLAANVPAAQSVHAGALVDDEKEPAAHAKQPLELANEPAEHGGPKPSVQLSESPEPDVTNAGLQAHVAWRPALEFELELGQAVQVPELALT